MLWAKAIYRHRHFHYNNHKRRREKKKNPKHSTQEVTSHRIATSDDDSVSGTSWGLRSAVEIIIFNFHACLCATAIATSSQERSSNVDLALTRTFCRLTSLLFSEQYRFLLNQITDVRRTQKQSDYQLSHLGKGMRMKFVVSGRHSLFSLCTTSRVVSGTFSSDNNIDGEKKWTRDEGKNKKMPVKANKRKLFTSLKIWNFYEKSRKSKQKKGKTRQKKQVLGSTIPIHLGIFFSHRSFLL